MLAAPRCKNIDLRTEMIKAVPVTTNATGAKPSKEVQRYAEKFQPSHGLGNAGENSETPNGSRLFLNSTTLFPLIFHWLEWFSEAVTNSFLHLPSLFLCLYRLLNYEFLKVALCSVWQRKKTKAKDKRSR